MIDLVIWKGLAVTRRNRLELGKKKKWPKSMIRQMEIFTEKARRKVKALENDVFLIGEIE